MKLNRSALRKMILNEIKSLQEDKEYGDLVYNTVLPIPEKQLSYFKNRKAAGKSERPTKLTIDFKVNQGVAEIQKVKDEHGNLYTDDIFFNQIFKGRKPLGEFLEQIKAAVKATKAGEEKEVTFKPGF